MKALISVYEKLGIVELAVDLKAKGYELISCLLYTSDAADE